MTSPTTAYIDGSQMLYRAEYGFPSRIVSRAGHDITGLFGFLALTRKALLQSPHRPTHAVVVFDADAPVPRARIDARYKSSRRLAPAGDSHNPFRHLPWIERALRVWGVIHIEHDHAEADDVIATLVDRGRAAGHEALVVSSDRDFHQLLEDGVSQWNSSRGRPEGWITPESVIARYGVHPKQWCDYVALVGDRADAMPGIRGIGPVTARRILRDGRTLDTAAEELTAPQLRDALRQRALHRLERHVLLQPPEPSALPQGGLLSAAEVLETLGLWDCPYP